MSFIREIDPDVSVWYHQPWGAVLACRGRPAIAARYAKLAGMGTSCRGKGLRGTAISWQNDALPGSDAFVVELGAGAISGRAPPRAPRATPPHVQRAAEKGCRAGRPSPGAGRARAGGAPGAAPCPRRSRGGRRRPRAKPRIAKRLIPYGPEPQADMAAYSKRHYGEYKWRSPTRS